jgi:hypothetical protein
MSKNTLDDEQWLVTCSPPLSLVTMNHLASALLGQMIVVGGQYYSISSVRVDEEQHKIYGRYHQIEELTPFRFEKQ